MGRYACYPKDLAHSHITLIFIGFVVDHYCISFALFFMVRDKYLFLYTIEKLLVIMVKTLH